MKQPRVDLKALKNKIHLRRMLILLITMGAVSAVLNSVIFICSRFMYIYGTYKLMLITLLVCIAIGAILGIFFRPSDLFVARTADAFGYDERFVTAEELGCKSELTEMESLALRDAVKIASEVRLDKKYSVKPPRKVFIILIASVIIFAVCAMLPIKKSEAVQSLESDHDKYDSVVDNMIETVESSKLTDNKKNEINKELNSLKKELAKTNSKSEAVEKIMNTQAELKKLSDSGENEQLKLIGDKLSENTETKALGDALKNNDADEFNNQITKLKDNVPDFDKDELNSLGQSFKSVADNSEIDDETKEVFNQLAETLQADTSTARLDNLSNELDGLSERVDKMSSENKDVRDTVDRVNKNLAKLSENTPQSSMVGNASVKNNGASNQEGQENTQSSISGENGTLPGDGSVPNENVYIANAKNYNDYAAELEDKSSDGSGDNQKSYVDGENGEIVPYNEVIGEYKNDAIAAVEKDGVPYGIRNIVMDYFSSLE
jgi:uncharacterized coiled-coil DUF342 family protein